MNVAEVELEYVYSEHLSCSMIPSQAPSPPFHVSGSWVFYESTMLFQMMMMR
jgi:hypothetical protein